MHLPKAIVIGAGIAGMAAAIRLSVQGYQVVVYEKNDYPGGKITTIRQDGYNFDSGPALLTEPGLIGSLFRLGGEPMDSYISWQPVPNSCRYFFASGKIVNAWTERQELVREFAEKLGEQPEALHRYLDRSEKIYNRVDALFMKGSLHPVRSWFNGDILSGLSALGPSLLYYTLNEYNENNLTTGEAIQIFNRFATCNGSNPYEAPAALSLIANRELNKGIRYPKGGMISIVNALYRLALKKGVVFEFNKNVSRIIHTGSQSRGIVLDGNNIFSDIVITDTDIHFAYSQLLHQPQKASALAKKEAGSSAVIFYWGIKKQFPNLHLHNVLFSAACRYEFEHIFKLKQVYKDPTVYINITAKMEQEHAPEGKENWVVMINAPSGTDIDWDKEIPQIKQQVLKKLRGMLKEDIEPLIETESILHPGIITRQTNTFRGALYGSSANNWRSAFFRPANYDEGFPGLYFCGGTVHPGGGIALCLKGAEIVAGLVKNEMHVDH